MQIQKQLPHFYEEPTAIVVSGTESFVLYYACDGEITQREAFKSKDDISYDEDWTMVYRSGGGKTYGIYLTDKKNEMQEEHKMNAINHIAEVLDEMAKNETIESVYLFAPSHVFPEVEKAVPASLRKHLKRGIKGNYIEHHPFDILELIRDEPKEKTVDFTTDA